MKKICVMATMIGMLSLFLAFASWAQPGMGRGGGQGRGAAGVWGQNALPGQIQGQSKQPEGNTTGQLRSQNQQVCPQPGMGAGQGTGRGMGRGMGRGQGGGQGRGQGQGWN